MKTIRTVRQIVENDEELSVQPKYSAGDLVEIYSGNHEGHFFKVQDVRYNHDGAEFEYLYDWPLYDEWHSEARLTLHRRAQDGR